MKKAIFLLIIFLIGNASRGYASYVVIDAHTSRTLFASAPELSLPIASLTKMWTALVVVENAELSEEVIVSRKAAYSEGSSIYLEEGEITTVETLLYGLMLRSGNDAAMALAEHVGGSEEGFVFLMNERAREAFGKKYGLGYMMMFKLGVYAPLVDLRFQYKKAMTYEMKPKIKIIITTDKPTTL